MSRASSKTDIRSGLLVKNSERNSEEQVLYRRNVWPSYPETVFSLGTPVGVAGSIKTFLNSTYLSTFKRLKAWHG